MAEKKGMVFPDQQGIVRKEASDQGAGDVPRIFRLVLALGQLSAGVAHGTKPGL